MKTVLHGYKTSVPTIYEDERRFGKCGIVTVSCLKICLNYGEKEFVYFWGNQIKEGTNKGKVLSGVLTHGYV